MRKAAIVVLGVALLAGVNLAVVEKEKVLREGELVLLELAPVDPRSLMQGDYMALAYAVEPEVRQALSRRDPPDQDGDGYLVVRPDEQRVGRLQQVVFQRPQALPPGTVAMRFRVRRGNIGLAGNSFFFEEGTAGLYEAARYGEFRVDAGGELLLTGLRDEQRHRLGLSTAP